MKIGFLHKVNTTPPRRGGSVHTYQVSRYLAARGHALLTLANEQGSHFQQRYPRSPVGLAALVREADVLYMRVDGRVGWEIAGAIPGLVASGKPIVWEINATLEESTAFGKKRWQDYLGAPLRTLAANRVNTALCVSGPLLAYARDLGIPRAVLVPNGSDPEMFRPELSHPGCYAGLEDQFRVLWAGSPDYSWHDFATVLRCATRLADQDPRISFVILGERPETIAGPLPVNVHFQPSVPYQEVPPFFAAADVGLCIYHPIHWSKYGFFFSPLKLFDYAASGVPVLYTDSPELDRLASGFGLPVGERDADALAMQILRLKHDRGLHAQLSRAGRYRAVEFYNWNRVGAQTEEALLGVCGERPPLPKSTVESFPAH